MESAIWTQCNIHGKLFTVSNEGDIKHKSKKGWIYHTGINITIQGKTFAKSRIIAHVYLGLDINNSNHIVKHKNSDLTCNYSDNLYIHINQSK